MNNSQSLLTINYKLDSIQGFISSISNTNNQYYFFVSNHIDANNTIRPYNNEEDTLVSSYQGMIFGKRIHSTDATTMIRRVNWTANTIYSMYDHRVTDLYSSNFYVSVQEGTVWNVFKCLENGGGAPSTVSPSKSNVSSTGDDFFYPTDGYRWKYMYSVSDADESKFATSAYFPVFVDANTKSQAVPGGIDVIQVTSPGRGYNNYFTGSFGVSDIRLNGNPRVYGISNTGINTANDFYTNCWMYISSGPGAGQYRLIQGYTSNSTHNFVTLDSEFDSSNTPENGSSFEIYPCVTITGDGRESLPAEARAIIDPSTNTVSRVEMINKGQNYFHATAQVQASGVVGVIANCGVVPIISPAEGHGYNPPEELGGSYAGISVQLIGSEANTVPTDNDYSQVGILRNPLFKEVDITLYNQNQDFYTNETVYKVQTAQLAGTVQTTLSNNQLTSVLSVAGVNASNIVSVGSTIMINYATNYQVANVASVSNTSITLDQNALWDTAGNTANISIATVLGQGVISGFAAGSVTLTNATGTFASGDVLIGATTGVYGQANAVTIGGNAKNFETFVQAYEYVGTVNQGTFQADEVVYQTSVTTANARFHSIEPDANTGTSRILVTNAWNEFNTSTQPGVPDTQIVGQTSGAIATLTNKYLPDLVYGSGDVIYIEYGDPITRAAEKTETFKLVFAF